MSGFGCKISSAVRNYKPVTLEYWGTTEDLEIIQRLTGAYTARHPKISITYQKIREEEYKQKVKREKAETKKQDRISEAWNTQIG